MAWIYKALSNTLAGLYYTETAIVSLVIDSGLRPGDYLYQGTADNVFTLMIKKLESQGKVKQLVSTALKEYPENPILKDVINDVTEDDMHNSVYAGAPPKMDPSAINKDRYEKITGDQSTLLPINFLELGLLRSTAVARIVTPHGLGSGFLINDNDLFLTNNHVIDKKPSSGSYKVQFNYQQSIKNLPLQYEEYEMDDSFFYTSIQEDWTIVKIKGNPSGKYGFIPLTIPNNVKESDFVNIIQHPGGEYKQIGLYHNVVTHADENVIQYLTDTRPGSSGSPVFNSSWEVVALHHSGGFLPVPGKGRTMLCNEGINIKRVINSLEALNIF